MPRAKRSLGQNFLVDPNIRRKILEAVDPQADQECLEIGPGHGALTDLLAGRVRRLTAVELDRQLALDLRNRFAGRDDVLILEADILRVPLSTIAEQTDRLRVVGNIPYNITTPILFHLLDRAARPADITLMVQREVADRISASAGQNAFGALSVGVQSVARVETLFAVGRHAFRPVPNVDSTVLRITPIRPFPLSAAEEDDLRSLTRTTFGWRRKQLQRSLRSSPLYRLGPHAVADLARRTGVNLDRRPETLDLDDWLRIARTLRDMGLPAPDRPPLDRAVRPRR